MRNLPARSRSASRYDAWLRRLAWLVWAVVVCLTAGAFGLLLAAYRAPVELSWGFRGVLFPINLAFATMGLLITSRMPRHRIGWLLQWAGLGFAVSGIGDEYAIYTLIARPGVLPGGEIGAWVSNWIWVPVIGPTLVLLFLLFPTGRLPSRRWLPALPILALATITLGAQYAFLPGPMESSLPIPNPFGKESPMLPVIGGLGFPLLILAILLGVAALAARWRGAAGAEREQLKWLVYAASLVGFAFPAAFLIGPFSVPAVGLVLASLFLVPVAVGVAILRHRLYDIDLIIRRTLVYGALTVALALVYFGSVVVLQTALRGLTGSAGQSQLAVVASTLAIAALFAPLRRRVQDFIDRRFYRKKYDAAQTLAAFAAAARDETDLDRLAGRLVSVVEETMQPAHVALWLRSAAAGRPPVEREP